MGETSNFIQIDDTIKQFIIPDLFLLYKGNKDILRKIFADDGDNPVNNPSIYNLERGYKVVAQPTTPDNRKCGANPFFFHPGSVVVFSVPEIIVLSFVKHG